MTKRLEHPPIGVGLVIAAACAVMPRTAAAVPFYTGGDVSLLPFIESRGGTFRDGGATKPADRIMVENGSNLFRLRLFVNPNTNYSATNGAIQSLSSTIALATRLKASGAKILLDFHYSDTWADPGQQAKPAAWSAHDFDMLKSTLRNYTRDSLIAFRDAGVMPEMVQVGNEVTNGMLWPSGQVLYSGSTATQNQSWRNFGGLLNAAISGVRDVDATLSDHHTLVAIHADGGSVEDRAQYFYGKLTNTALVSPASYDILGLSFYPSASNHLSHLQENLQFIANSTPLKTMVLEANQPWRGSANGSQWASTPIGQRDYWIAVRDAVRNLPNDKGLGALWWYPEAIQVPGTNIWKGGAIALFDDTGGDALPAMAQFNTPGSMWALDGSGDWLTSGNWVGTVPNTPDAVARFGPHTSVPRSIEVSTAVMAGSVTFLSDSAYNIVGTGLLNFSTSGGAARIESIRGNHSIDVPIHSTADVELGTAWTSGLEFRQPLDASGHRVMKVGSGSVLAGRIDCALLDVQFGTLRLTSASAGMVESLSIGVQGNLQLDAGLVIDIDSGEIPEAASSIRALIVSGRLEAADPSLGIGYADSAALGVTRFLGVDLDPTNLLLRATIAGDSTLDGTVDFDDLLTLAQHYGSSDVHWWQGDFTYDGAVDFADLLLLVQNYQTSLAIDAGSSLAAGNAFFQSDLRLAMSIVPEPTTLIALASLTARRRRLS